MGAVRGVRKKTAINVFARNLHDLLMAAPLSARHDGRDLRPAYRRKSLSLTAP